MSAPLVELAGVSHGYPAPSRLGRDLFRRRRRIPVLHDVSMRIDSGRWQAVVGANGEGKTTILKLVAGLLRAESGSVRLDGVDVARRPALARETVGYALADERSFFWRLSARHNLEFFASLDGLHGRDAARRIDELLAALDLSADADRVFAGFSTGMRQRLAIARALLPRPRVLLLDEPTRGLDATHAEGLWSLVTAEVEAAEGCAILVTHELQDALDRCHSVALLDGGRILMQDTRDGVGARSAGIGGFTVTVRGLPAAALPRLRAIAGVRDVHLSVDPSGEQFLEVAGREADGALPAFISEIVAAGAGIVSLRRGGSVQALLARLGAERQVA